MTSLINIVFDSDRLVEKKIFISKPNFRIPDEQILATIGSSDSSFATMNQIVIGNPPLWTTGASTCSVIGAKFGKNQHMLCHVSSDYIYSSRFWKLINSFGHFDVACVMTQYGGMVRDNLNVNEENLVLLPSPGNRGDKTSQIWDGNTLKFGKLPRKYQEWVLYAKKHTKTKPVTGEEEIKMIDKIADLLPGNGV